MAEIVVKLVNGELAGKTAQQISKEVGAAATALKKAEIGTKAWVDANKRLEDARKVQEDLKKQIEGTATASDMLKNAFNKLPGAQYFNQIGESFGMMKKGVGGLISQFGMLKTAIASSGVGLLVLLLGSLYTWFTKTEEGADKLKGVLYPLQVLFQKLTGILADLGGKVFKRLAAAFEDPVQAIKDLGQALLDNVINRFKSLAVFGDAIMKLLKGNFKEGFKSLADASIQLATGVTDATDKMNAAFEATIKVWDEAYEAGQKLLELENAIEDAETALVKSRAQLNVEAAKAMEIASNASKTDEERLEAAREFQRITDLQTQQEEDLLNLKLKKLKLEQQLDGIQTDDEKLERAKMEADLIQLQADNIEKRKKARSLEIGLVQEIAKREADIAQNIARLKVEASQDGFQQELAQIEEQTAERIAALQGSEAQILEQKLLLKEIESQQMIALGEKYQAIENENARKAADEKKKIEDKAASDKKKQMDEKLRQEQEMASAVADITKDSFQFLGDVAQRAGVKSKGLRKSLGLVDLGINLQTEMSANALAASQNPLNGVTFGAAGAAQLVKSNAMSLIRAAFGAARITAFKKGGIPSMVLRGPSHDQGGIPLVAEGDEIILTKGVYRDPRLRSIASQINVAAGGRSFAAGGPAVYADRSRGPVSRSGESSQLFDYSEMARHQAKANKEMIDAAIYRIEVQNVATKTRDVIEVVNEIQASADI